MYVAVLLCVSAVVIYLITRMHATFVRIAPHRKPGEQFTLGYVSKSHYTEKPCQQSTLGYVP